MNASENLEIEVKLAFHGAPGEAQELIESRGFRLRRPRTLESDTVFDLESGELRRADQLLRLRREGATARVTYKGPPRSTRYKSREEIEFDVSDDVRFTLLLDRLGYHPGWKYEKYRTEFAAGSEAGVVTIDETPIGIYLELEGAPEWIDRTAARLGFSPADYITASYAVLYRQYQLRHPGAPLNMTF